MNIDKRLIRYELVALKKVDDKREVHLLTAARKLENNYADKTMIADVLAKMLAQEPYRVSKSYVIAALPNIYKRPTVKKLQPKDLFEELLVCADDAYGEIRATNKQLLKLYRSRSPMEQRKIISEFEDTIHEAHGKFGTVYRGVLQEMASMDSLQSLQDALNGMRNDARILRRMSDPRIKLRRWLKIRLKSAYLTHTTGHIAAVMGISHTWAKKIRHTAAYDTFMQELQCCPQCGYNLLAYIDKADEAHRAGQPIPAPLILPKAGQPYTHQ